MNTESPELKFVDNWKTVATKAWSIKLILLAGLCSGLEVALPYLPEIIEMPQGTYAAIAGVVTLLASVARLLVQKELQPTEDTKGEGA